MTQDRPGHQLLTVLLVEDEPAHAELVEESFADELPRARVHVVRSLAEARAAGPPGFDVVVSDLRLPDGSGTALLSDPGPTFPLVIMTSQGDERAAVDAIKAGALDYVVKSPSVFASMPHIAVGAAREWRQLVARRAAEGQLQHADRLIAVGRLASVVFHEIGTPLSVIRMHAQLLELDAEPVSEAAPLLMEQVDRISALVCDALAYARVRPTPGTSAFVPAEVERALRLLSVLLRRARVEVVREVAPARVAMEPGRLLQVLVNLGTNALHAMPDGGTLSVVASTDDGWVALEVRDTGVGIAPDDLPLLFTPFFTTKAEGAGTGLGLAVCRGLVEAVGGTVDVDSSPGGGARFCVRLPQAS